MRNYNEQEHKLVSKMIELGFNISNKGFNYILDSIQAIAQSDDNLKITYLYAYVASKNNTTSTRVERCIRSEVESFYNLCTIIPAELVGYYGKGKLTNGEFLYRLAYMLYKQQ